MPAHPASSSTAPTKSRCSTSRMKVMTSPRTWQPQQRYRPSSWFTLKLGVFSAWNGQSPTHRWPDAAELGVLRDHADDVGGLPHGHDVVVDDAHCRPTVAGGV